MKWKPFGPIQTPADMLEKLRHDLGRMEANPGDIYAAFDFCMTAEAMLDWQWPGKAGKTTRERAKRLSGDLATVSHLANGAKHYEVSAPHHQSVGDMEMSKLAFQGDAFQRRVVQVGAVMIHRQDGSAVDAIDLGRSVVRFWEIELGS
jgi:hypothetical protein